jgi:transaldolase
MAERNYFQWLVEETPTTWWHDSADPIEVQTALGLHASGVTTNPVLGAITLETSRDYWKAKLDGLPEKASPDRRTESLYQGIVSDTASFLSPQYTASGGECGYVCGQVNPTLAYDAEAMVVMARRFSQWAPNVSVKLPVTAAGLAALETCVSEGICVTGTVSFTVPQVMAIAQAHHRGLQKAQKAGRKGGRCFAVIMIGRLDDYLYDMARDRKAAVSEAEVRQAGIAVVKRAYDLFQREKYTTTLLVAALRGVHHMEAFAGGRLVMSVHPTSQKLLLKPGVGRNPRQIDEAVDPRVIERLRTLPDFVRAYEPDGMKPEEFYTFGLSQRTLSQFILSGWSKVDNFRF